MLKKVLAALSLVGVAGYITYAIAAGLFPNFPIVGSATYCGGASQSATGTIIGLVTGCPNQVPAGPTVVTGNELVPADTQLASGANPQTVLIPMGSLNALPLTISSGLQNTAANAFSPTNKSGGILMIGGVSTNKFSPTDVTLPPNAIDGQQFVFAADTTIATLKFVPASGDSVTNQPTVLTTSTTASFNYKFEYNLANKIWSRLQ